MERLDELQQQLQRFLLEKQSKRIAETYREIIDLNPQFSLVPGVQFDLARYLDKGGHDTLALHAYDRLVSSHPDAPITGPALLTAARLCSRSPGSEEDGVNYLKRFLQTQPSESDRVEAIELMARLKHRIKHDEAEARRSGSPSPQEAPPLPREPQSKGQLKSADDSDVLVKERDKPRPLQSRPSKEKLGDALFQPSSVEQSRPIDELPSSMAGEEIIFNGEDAGGGLVPPQPPPSGQKVDSVRLDDLVIEIEDQYLGEEGGGEGGMDFPPLGEDHRADEPEPPRPAPDQSDSLPNLAPSEYSNEFDQTPPGLRRSDSQPDPSHPGSPSQFLRKADELQKDFDAQRLKKLAKRRMKQMAGKKDFAIVLPQNRRIHPKKIARALAPYLDRSPQQILDVMKSGKGILFEDVSLQTFRDLVRVTRPISPDLLYVHIPPLLRFTEPQEVNRLQIDARGVKAWTNTATIEFSWMDVLMISCGRVYLDEMRRSGKNLCDIFLRRDRVHLRIWDATLNYKASGLPFDPLGEQNFADLMGVFYTLAKTRCTFSQTALRLLRASDGVPQRFESINAYGRFNRWSLYNLYARRVNI